MNDNVDISFFRFVTIHAFDRQRDGRTDGQKGLEIPCVAKTSHGENHAIAVTLETCIIYRAIPRPTRTKW